MLASRIALRSVNLANLKSANSNFKVYYLTYRNFQTKSTLMRAFRSQYEAGKVATGATLSTTPLTIGRGLTTVASVVGLGALAYYGLGSSNQAGLLDKSAQWPQLVRDRVSTTYQYVFSSIGVTALSMAGILRSPTLMNLASKSTITASLVTLGLVIGSGMVVRSIPYDSERFNSKQLAWMVHCALIGSVIAPLTIFGGPLMIRAAVMTAGLVGGLSLIAATAPSEKFLNMAGPLGLGLGVVFAASVGGMFLPPTTRLGLSLYSVAMYGGLVLFSLLLMYDTQKICKHAETHMQYDPVNESISIYLDIVNIFIRMVVMLSTSNSRRK